MTRGPKVRTAQNTARGQRELIRHETLDAPSDLTEAATKEYDRLVGVLQGKGTLDRVDLAIVADAARVKVLLDDAYADITGKPSWEQAKLIGLLNGQRRGMMRELGLTTQPNLSRVKANPIGSERDENPSQWAGKLKIS